MTLELSARKLEVDLAPRYVPLRSKVEVSLDGEEVETLSVPKEHADELVRLLNTATEMLEALVDVAFVPFDGAAYCWCDHWVDARESHSAECVKARAVVAKAKGAT